MHQVFISYSHKDQHTMELISSTLESRGIRCWYAPRDIAPGRDWREAITEAIASSKVFILVYSKHSNQSRQVLNEVTAAFDAGCILIPFRIDDTQMIPALSFYLNNVHWMEASGALRSKADELAHLVMSIPGIVADHRVSQQPTVNLFKVFALTFTILIGIITAGLLFFQILKDPVPFCEDSAAIEQAYDSVVQILCYESDQLVSGTVGFACFADHIIVTDANLFHFLTEEEIAKYIGPLDSGGQYAFFINTNTGMTYTVKEILAVDWAKGIAILSTEGSHNLPLLPAGNTDSLKLGDRMVALGTRLTFGEFLGKEKLTWEQYEDHYIVFSGMFYGGDGGSPLMNNSGEVVGMLSFSSDRCSYMIPMERIQEVWNTCAP